MKKQTVSKLIVLLAALTLVIGMIAGCGSSNTPAGSGAAPAGSAAVADADAEAAANVDALIAAIQFRNGLKATMSVVQKLKQHGML